MNKKNIKKYILNVAIILLVGGLSIYFSIGNQLEGTIESLSHCHLGWLLVVVILMLIFYLINAMNLTLFARVYKEDYCLKQGIVNAMAGIFFNGITPWHLEDNFIKFMLLINKELKQLILRVSYL